MMRVCVPILVKLRTFIYIYMCTCTVCGLPVCHKHAGKSIYADHCEALQLAVEYVREKNGDPEFSLGIDPYADVSTLSQKKATPNHSNKSRTPHNGSHVMRSGMCSSTGKKAAKNGPKSATTASLSTSRKGKNGRVIDATINSPILPDDPEYLSEGMKLESSKRKRSRDSSNTEGNEGTTAEVKRQKTSTQDDSEHSPEGKEENGGGGGVSSKEVIPRKLNFNDEWAMDGEDTCTSGSIQEGPPLSIPPDSSQEGSPISIPPDSSQEGPSTCKEQGPPNSSPVSESGPQPSSVCEGTLSNGLPSVLPCVEGESTVPVEGDKGEEQRQRGAERGGTGGLPCARMSGSEDGDDNVMSVEAGEGSGGGFSDSDDDSMPTFSCKVTEDLKCKLKIYITCTYVIIMTCMYNVHLLISMYMY